MYYDIAIELRCAYHEISDFERDLGQQQFFSWIFPRFELKRNKWIQKKSPKLNSFSGLFSWSSLLQFNNLQTTSL